MIFVPLDIPGAFLVRNTVHRDERGDFMEWFRADNIAAHTGYHFQVKQANLSRSAQRVVRGIHYADIPPGQAKVVTCVQGSIRDVVVDIRVGSPTFGTWTAVDLDAATGDAVLLPVGVGHAFVAKEDNTLVSYLVSEVYTPQAEHGIHPLDSELAIDFGYPHDQLLLSPKDHNAPTLAEVKANGRLPVFDSEVQ